MSNSVLQSTKGNKPSHSGSLLNSSGISDIYIRVLLILAPVASFLVVPVQGMTPANIILYSSLFIPFFGIRYQIKFLVSISLFIFLYSLYLFFSLSSYLISTPNLTYLTEIRRIFIIQPLRQTHVTQGLYLLSAMIFLYHVAARYSKEVLNYAYYGIIIFIIYGYYQFVFYAIFGFSGDFLTNRDFGGEDITSSNGVGGWIQFSPIFGSPFIRFYSLTGEPSFFALTATPFFIFAFALRSRRLALFIFSALFLSSSTTAVVGIIAGLFVIYCRDSKYVLFGVPLFLGILIISYFTIGPFQLLLDRLILEKLNTESGSLRTEFMLNHLAVILDGNPMRLLFGLGFGTVRSADMLSTLLANTGLLGFIGYSALILRPCFFLSGNPLRIPLQAVLWSIWTMEMVGVSEYAYLPPWFFVGMAYWHSSLFRKGRTLVVRRVPQKRLRQAPA